MGYSIKRNIQQLVDLMEQHAITDVVISPGSRNMPLAQTFASHPSFHCYPVTDERSAGFQAIGLALSLQKPVAVCVTSGSSLLNLTSSVSEAFYQQVPLLVISADRPEAWIGQMDGQTLPQMGVFGSLIRKEVSIADSTDEEQMWHNNRMINEALLEVNHRVGGPVHINVPIKEPFFDCSATTLPRERVIRRTGYLQNMDQHIERWKSAERRLIVVGQMKQEEASHIAPHLSALHCPILCENLSNLPFEEPFIHHADLMLACEDMEEYAPDLLIYIGGHIVSKRLKKWFRSVQPAECWRVDPEGVCADTFQCLNRIVESQPVDFVASLPPIEKKNDYLSKWLEINHKYSANIVSNSIINYSSLYVVQELLRQLPENYSLVLANSSVVRYAQLFPLKKGVTVTCNRGVNGIDGSLSSAIGYALARPEQLVFLLIGDLSFFYDMNAMWRDHFPTNLRIILINNGGGEIFRTLPGLEQNEETLKYVMACHGTTAQGWMESLGVHYYQVKSEREASIALRLLMQMSIGQQAMVAEFLVDGKTDEEVYREFYSSLKN